MQELKKIKPKKLLKSRSKSKKKQEKYVSIGSEQIKESDLWKMMKQFSLSGPDPQEGLISKITLVLNGEHEVLETLNEEEIELMWHELSVIRNL